MRQSQPGNTDRCSVPKLEGVRKQAAKTGAAFLGFQGEQKGNCTEETKGIAGPNENSMGPQKTSGDEDLLRALKFHQFLYEEASGSYQNILVGSISRFIAVW